jgi:hypothetical protein
MSEWVCSLYEWELWLLRDDVVVVSAVYKFEAVQVGRIQLIHVTRI